MIWIWNPCDSAWLCHGKFGKASWVFSKENKFLSDIWIMRLFSKPFGNRFALPQPQAKKACVFALSSGGCSLAPWVGRTLPVSSLSLSVSVSFAFCLFRATHSIAKRVQQYQQQRRQHHQQQQQQLTQIILVEFRNFYFNSVISKKYTQHRQRQG